MERGARVHRIKTEEVLITANDIHLITGVNMEIAVKEHEYIRKALGYGSEDLLITQYCEFNDLDYEEILSFLHPVQLHFFQ